MEKSTDLEGKYQKLASEYSKVRSQATVLKKAVLDEQARNAELKETIKLNEQTIRKHAQEMESLTFRNDQLTKRISVLQQDLQQSTTTKKNVKKPPDNTIGVLDEEFEKKILENAQLLSSISDKEFEIDNYRSRIQWLEDKVLNFERELSKRDDSSNKRLSQLQQENTNLLITVRELTVNSQQQSQHTTDSEQQWKAEIARLTSECALLRSKPTSNDQLTHYYETQLEDCIEKKTLAVAETRTLLAENQAITNRLENLTIEHRNVVENLDKIKEELTTTSDNYRSQLDAMTEHFAAQNDKITQQCDEIELLKHKLLLKK